jgi:hypothetical protein
MPIKRLRTPLEQTDAAHAETPPAIVSVDPSVATPVDVSDMLRDDFGSSLVICSVALAGSGSPLICGVMSDVRVSARYMVPDREMRRAPSSGNLMSAVSPSLGCRVLLSLRAKPEASGRIDRWGLPNESMLPGVRVWVCMIVLGSTGAVSDDSCTLRDSRALPAATAVSRYVEVS